MYQILPQCSRWSLLSSPRRNLKATGILKLFFESRASVVFSFENLPLTSVVRNPGFGESQF
jgi:hypothetical protein